MPHRIELRSPPTYSSPTVAQVLDGNLRAQPTVPHVPLGRLRGLRSGAPTATLRFAFLVLRATVHPYGSHTTVARVLYGHLRAQPSVPHVPLDHLRDLRSGAPIAALRFDLPPPCIELLALPTHGSLHRVRQGIMRRIYVQYSPRWPQ